MSEKFPNFDSHPDTPDISSPGVRIALGTASYAPGQPVVLRGTFVGNAAMRREMRGLLDAGVIVILVRRDRPSVSARPLQESHNTAKLPEDMVYDAAMLVRGFFNLDLARFFDALEPGGRYWVMACLGDHVSERLELEVRVK